MARILLADDHPMVLHGLRAVIEGQPDLEVAGAATSAAQAMELLAGLRPDVLVLDLLLPDMGGVELLRLLQAGGATTRVVIFSMHANDTYVRAALQAGAIGFVIKDAPAEELVAAIRAALRGERYLCAAITDRAINVYLQHSALADAPIELLTARERQILGLIAGGATSVAIAERLQISPRTVETHRANLARKLGLQSAADLLRYAIAHGLGEPEE